MLLFYGFIVCVFVWNLQFSHRSQKPPWLPPSSRLPLYIPAPGCLSEAFPLEGCCTCAAVAAPCLPPAATQTRLLKSNRGQSVKCFNSSDIVLQQYTWQQICKTISGCFFMWHYGPRSPAKVVSSTLFPHTTLISISCYFVTYAPFWNWF